MNDKPSNVEFYDRRRGETYHHEQSVKQPSDHSSFEALRQFIQTFDLERKKCLEIGSGNGVFHL